MIVNSDWTCKAVKVVHIFCPCKGNNVTESNEKYTSSKYKSTQLVFLFTGDIRANEHHGLTVMHTLWMREHNKIAKLLSQQYPSWTDEKLYQEARRIVIAEYQHIAFREWLPQVVGTQFCIDCELTPLQGISYHTEPWKSGRILISLIDCSNVYKSGPIFAQYSEVPNNRAMIF